MARSKEAFTIRERGDKLILTLDRTGWDPVNGRLFELTYSCYGRLDDKSVAECLGEAIRLYAKHHFRDAAEGAVQDAKKRVAMSLAVGRDAYGGKLPRQPGPKPDDTM